MGLGIFCIDHLNCCLTAGSGAFCFSEGRICGKTVLNIRFLDVTEKGDILFLQKNLQVSADVYSSSWDS